MNPVYEKLLKCTKSVKARIGGFKPQIAIVLGTGLNSYGETVEQFLTLDYKDIDGFPVSTVEGHIGRYIFGYVDNIPVVIMQGRVHYYEGYSMDDVVLPIRLMGLLGAEILFITNGVGAVNKNFEPGDLMLINDHLSLFIPSPLIGDNIDEIGPRFPDMTEVYCKNLRNIIRKTAQEQGISLKEGVYVMLTGPQYETPEEIRLIELLGGDVVGMSSVCEAIAANHMGMKICGVSSIGNMGAGIVDKKLEHKPSSDASEDFVRLINHSIINIAKTM